MTFLERTTSPEDLRGLDAADLPALATEIREFLVTSVSATGGHLGPNLGVVELTLAVHRVFRSPRDPIVFDTGHQAYVHKLLTGRAAGFPTLRAAGGLSGYPSRHESEHDVAESSHASMSLSYADGLATAIRLRGENAHVVAIIGDGALTGGPAWEGLNNLAARSERPVVVVVNDNGRSYSSTVGGLAAALRSGGTGPAGALAAALGLDYLGPVDGHDIAATEAALRGARDLGRTAIVHVVTEKGRGFAPAEHDESQRMHSVGPLDPETGEALDPDGGGPSFTSVLGEELLAAAERDPAVVALSAAMPGPTGLAVLAERLPARVVDVGIAEAHSLASAAGMALRGLRPVVALYSTFLGRAVDQLLMDVALLSAPVTVTLDRAGITGPDGPSHHGVWDLALARLVPGLRAAAPRDAATLRAELAEALAVDSGPTLVRFPKGSAGDPVPAVATVRAAPGDDTPGDGALDLLAAADHVVDPPSPTSVESRRPAMTPQAAMAGRPVLLVAVGPMARPCLDAARRLRSRGVSAVVVDPRWVLPVPRALVELAAGARAVAVVEDGIASAGVGDALLGALTDAGYAVPLRRVGTPDSFVAHGARGEILRELGLTGEAIADAVLDGPGEAPRRRPD